MSGYSPLPTPDQQEDRFPIAEAVNHLLTITVTEPAFMKQSEYGMTKVVRVSITDHTSGAEYQDVLFFQTVLVRALSALPVGAKVLAYLRLGVATPGKSAPYLLVDASQDPDALALATGTAKADQEHDAAVDALKDMLA